MTGLLRLIGWLAAIGVACLALTPSAGGAGRVGTPGPWGGATDGARVLPGLSWSARQLAELHGSDRLNAIANDLVGAGDMLVALEDDPAEWATMVGPESDSVLGFVMLGVPQPSPLYHTILLGPTTYTTWVSWLSSGSPAGDEQAFAVAAMTLIHESLHWKYLSGDEAMVNACALADFPHDLVQDFDVPETITETKTVSVPVKTTKRVPVTKVVVTTKRVKVHGKWVVRTTRKRVTTYVTKTTTSYRQQTLSSTVPNPLYVKLVADAQDFYTNGQAPPYNSGTCPYAPAGTPPASYHVKACWAQFTGGSWDPVAQTAAATSFGGADIVARGAGNFWGIVELDAPPTQTFDAPQVTLVQPNGETFLTYTVSQAWSPKYVRWAVDFGWRWSDGSLFFQHPEWTGTGTWTYRWTFPDGEVCNASFAVS